MLDDPRKERRSPATSAPSFAASADDEIDLYEVVRTLWRRKILIGMIVFLITGATAVITSQMTPQYTADALLEIDTQGPRILRIEDIAPALTATAASLETQAEILKSRTLTARVVSDLKLRQDNEFNPELPQPKNPLAAIFAVRKYIALLNPIQYIPRAWLDKGVDSGTELPSAVGPVADPVVENVRGAINVAPVGQSHILRLTARSRDPSKAARIANHFLDTYLSDQSEAKRITTQNAIISLEERLVDLSQRVIDSENQVELYRADAGLLETKNITVTDQQLSEVNSQLVAVGAQRAATVARLRQLQRLVKQPGAADSAPEVLNSPLIQRLREQEADLLRKEADLSARYGDKHPKMINVRAELQDLRNSIRQEINKVIQGLANEVEVVQARERSLRASLKQLEGQAITADKSSVRLRELEREGEANRTIYEAVLNRLLEAQQQLGLQEPDAQIVSGASVPSDPSAPRPKRMTALAFAGSLFLGIIATLLLDKVGRGFRSSQDLQRLSGYRVLGLVPKIEGLPRPGRKRTKNLISDLDSSYNEAVRTVRINLEMQRKAKGGKVLLVTSALPNEGKSILAASIAEQTVRGGGRCIIVDCDFRRSRVHDLFLVSATQGLSDFFHEQAGMQEIIKTDEASGVAVITSGSQPLRGLIKEARPSQDEIVMFFKSERFEQLLENLGIYYDHIILDAPPVMLVSETRVLAGIADQTVYLVHWQKTRRNVALTGLRYLTEHDANIEGLVLSQVDVRKYEKFGYADLDIYSGAYARYY